MITAEKALETGVEAVVYGLPLIVMELTMQNATNTAWPRGMSAPINQFANVPRFPAADFKQVVRANVDTLYSSAFLDLSKEPLVLSVPEMGDRYYLLPMFDAWTNVFASPGTRTTGNGAADFVIVGPDWTGELPAGLQVLRSTTNMVWILGRTQTNGPDDYAAVHVLQAQFRLTPLSAFGKAYTAPLGTVNADFDSETAPVDKVKAMPAARYFDALARLLVANPPAAADAPLLARLETIGIVPGKPFDPSQLEPSVAAALEKSVATALAKLQHDRKGLAKTANGWASLGASLGDFGTDYTARGIIALIAFGANLPADAIYPTAYLDGEGRPLHGSHDYVIHFEKGQLPPVRAFWSITLYDADSFFADNELHRLAISSWMPLVTNADGSVDLYVQHASPGKDKEANWLPSPEGSFNLTLRMYWPSATPPSILDGSWSAPGLVRA